MSDATDVVEVIDQGFSSQWLAINFGENVKYPFGERSEPMLAPSDGVEP